MRIKQKRMAVLAAAIAPACFVLPQCDGGSALAAVRPLIINTGSNNQWTSVDMWFVLQNSNAPGTDITDPVTRLDKSGSTVYIVPSSGSLQAAPVAFGGRYDVASVGSTMGSDGSTVGYAFWKNTKGSFSDDTNIEVILKEITTAPAEAGDMLVIKAKAFDKYLGSQGLVYSKIFYAPEPATWVLMALGFAGLSVAGRRATQHRGSGQANPARD